jgi:hypothetical protein
MTDECYCKRSQKIPKLTKTVEIVNSEGDSVYGSCLQAPRTSVHQEIPSVIFGKSLANSSTPLIKRLIASTN